MHKSWGVGGGLQHFSVSPRPLGFGFDFGLDNITEDEQKSSRYICSKE